MSDTAGPICNPDAVKAAAARAATLNAKLRDKGIWYDRPSEASRALQWHQMALSSEAVLRALDYYISNGGGSRGARAICAPDGQGVPLSKDGPITDFRFRVEQPAHRDEQIIIRLDGAHFAIGTRPNRNFDEDAKSFFERDWPDWLTGGIFDLGKAADVSGQ